MQARVDNPRSCSLNVADVFISRAKEAKIESLEKRLGELERLITQLAGRSAFRTMERKQPPIHTNEHEFKDCATRVSNETPACSMMPLSVPGLRACAGHNDGSALAPHDQVGTGLALDDETKTLQSAGSLGASCQPSDGQAFQRVEQSSSIMEMFMACFARHQSKAAPVSAPICHAAIGPVFS